MPTDESMVMATLRHEGVPLLASELARWTCITPGAARRALQRLAVESLVVQNENGYWFLTEHFDGAAPD